MEAKNITLEDFEKMTYEERRQFAFNACGCYEAYPYFWQNKNMKVSRVECLHIDCQIARGEAKPIDKTKGILQYERESGWLRFLPEISYQKIYNLIIEKAEELKEYDPWKIDWRLLVYSAIQT